MIELENIRFSYEPGEMLLDDISFSVEAGERVTILGPGGCGKSTILKLICGLLKPDEGKISLFSEDLWSLTDVEKNNLLKSVGIAFQQGGLFDFMSVSDNLKFAMSNMTQLSATEMDDVVEDLLGKVKLARTKDMFPYELSGGMQRRVGIARALCTNPVISIFDEPTAGLDPVTSTIILNMIAELGARVKNSSLICCTSNVEIGIRFASRIILIHEGKIVADGNWKDLLLNGDEWTRYFLGTRFIGLDLEYARGLNLPEQFIEKHW